MKKNYLLTALVVLFYFIPSKAQWTILSTGASTTELRSACFTSSQTGYVVGSDSFVYKTLDAGATWNAVVSVANDTLRNVFFTDDTTGYAVGAKGHIIKTTDAGSTWSLQVSNTTSLLRSVHFPTHETGYIAGGNGTLLKTTDGGATWTPQVSGTIQDMISIRFINADTGYSVSSLATFTSGLILKTTDGGNTWDTVYTNAYGFLSVFPAGNDSVVYAVGGAGTIVKSSDAGLTWTVQPTGLATTVNLRASFFLSADTGYVSGDVGSLFYTSDGGTTWTNQSFPAIAGYGLLGMYAPVSDTVYVAATAGVVLRYSKPCALAAEPGQIFGGTTVCEGATLDYSIAPVPNALSYTWTGPAGSVIASGQGDTLISMTLGNSSGNISVTADNLCGPSVPHLLTIIVNPLPGVPTISTNAAYLVSSPASTYQWYFNNTLVPGADQSSYIPPQNGAYSVVITNSFGCTASSAAYTVVNATVPEFSNNPVTIAPMPFNATFSIFFSEEVSAYKNKMLALFDVNGRKLYEYHLTGKYASEIDSKDITSGVLIYELRDGDKLISRGKLVKF